MNKWNSQKCRKSDSKTALTVCLSSRWCCSSEPLSSMAFLKAVATLELKVILWPLKALHVSNVISDKCAQSAGISDHSSNFCHSKWFSGRKNESSWEFMHIWNWRRGKHAQRRAWKGSDSALRLGVIELLWIPSCPSRLQQCARRPRRIESQDWSHNGGKWREVLSQGCITEQAGRLCGTTGLKPLGTVHCR